MAHERDKKQRQAEQSNCLMERDLDYDTGSRVARLSGRLERWGWELRICPSTSRYDVAYGTFEMIDVTCGFLPWPGPWEGMYGASLCEIENWLGWFERRIDSDPLDPSYDPEPRPPSPIRRYNSACLADDDEPR